MSAAAAALSPAPDHAEPSAEACDFSKLRGDALLAAPYQAVLSKNAAREWLEALKPKNTLGLAMVVAMASMDRAEMIAFLEKVKAEDGDNELKVVLDALTDAKNLFDAGAEVAEKVIARYFLGLHVVYGFSLDETTDPEDPG